MASQVDSRETLLTQQMMQPATRLVAGYLADRSLRCDDDIGFGDSAWRMPSSHRTRAIRLTCTQFARQQSFPSSVRSHLYHCPHFIFSTHVYRLHRSSPPLPLHILYSHPSASRLRRAALARAKHRRCITASSCGYVNTVYV